MCHLFAISASAPRTLGPFVESLAPFSEKESPDGWGVAASLGGKTTLVKEPRAFAAALRRGNGDATRSARIPGDVVLFHIREASVGKLSLPNTQPFRRSLQGRSFLFIHNGTLRQIKDRRLRRLGPAGDTDSEHAFLWLLESMPLGGPARFVRWLKERGDEIRAGGKFNFILAEGRTLWAFADTALHWCTRVETLEEGRGAAARRKTPGRRGARRVRSVLLSTCPFTQGDSWARLSPGSLLVARAGRVLTIVQ
jgi:glutamine amidotransferase